jgi:hypothetical protein
MKIGTDVITQKDYHINDTELLNNNTFVTGITRSGKTNLILKLIEIVRSEEFKAKHGEVPIIIFDTDGEYLNVPKIQSDFVLFENEGKYAEIFNIENAKSLAQTVRNDLLSIVIKLTDFANREDREKFVAEFIRGLRTDEREDWHPMLVLIDEADLFIPTVSKQKNSHSRFELIECAKRGLKEGISMFVATQTASSVHIDLRRQCFNQIMGGQAERSDRRVASEMLDNPDVFNKLWNLKRGEFFVRGRAFTNTATLVQVDKASIDTPTIGIKIESKSKETVQEFVVNRMQGSTKNLIETYEEKIAKLQDEIKILNTTQWTQQKQQSAYDEGKFDGRLQTQDEYKKKSLVDRVLNK